VSSPPTIEPFAEMATLRVPVLSSQTPLTLAALVAVPILAWVLYRTPLGLAIRMVGENPAAVEGQGIDVVRLRTGAVVAGSALMGVAGAFLTLSAFNAFYFNMVNGRGWICIALVVFAGWRRKGARRRAPVRVLRRIAAAAAAAGGRHSVSALSDAALSAVDRRADRRRPARRLSAGADEAVAQGRALKPVEPAQVIAILAAETRR
jgi:hypothetical protein